MQAMMVDDGRGDGDDGNNIKCIGDKFMHGEQKSVNFI